jgi:Uma2 family endonuclease
VAERSAVVASDWDRPEADIVVARLPDGADIALVVDIADDGAPAPGPVRQIAYKRTHVVAYAQAGVPELWIVDVANRRVEVYRGPRGRGFTEVRILDDRDAVEVAGVPWPIASLLPA